MLKETKVIMMNDGTIDESGIAQAAEVIRKGGLVAFPTETVYGVGANALDAAAVEGIFAAKRRPKNDPIIVHISSLAMLEEVTSEICPEAFALAERFWPGPLTMILPRNPAVPALVSSGLATLAVRMPAHPIAAALIEAAGVPIAAPSANLFSRPSSTKASHVLEDLAGRVDLIIDGGEARIGVESTVLDLGSRTVLRPGGVPIEAIAEVLPDVSGRQIVYAMDSLEAGASPGMLIRHYAPSSPVTVFEGVRDRDVLTAMIRAYQEAGADTRTAVVVSDEDRALLIELGQGSVHEGDIHLLGSRTDEGAIARGLFSNLRLIDRLGYDRMLIRSYAGKGIAPAVRDRLFRAAEGRVITIE